MCFEIFCGEGDFFQEVSLPTNKILKTLANGTEVCYNIEE